jgi:hypothetical protein
MKLRIHVVLGLILALALAPAFWSDRGSARAQSDRKSSESLQPELAATWAGPVYSSWSVPEPLPALNSALQDLPCCISPDGLSIYVMRTSSVTGQDLYVAHRPDPQADWSAPVKLPNGINTSANERAAWLSADGLSLYFGSDRAGGMGGFDLYVSRRTDVEDDSDWGRPDNLSEVNTSGFEAGPVLLDQTSGTTELYFSCNPEPGGTDLESDIFVSILGPGGFEPPHRVLELSSPNADMIPRLRHDGLEIYFTSDRSGSVAAYRSRRSSTADRWTPPVAAIDPGDLGDPRLIEIWSAVLSWDGTMLYMAVSASGRPEDIYVSHRTKVLGTLDP